MIEKQSIIINYHKLCKRLFFLNTFNMPDCGEYRDGLGDGGTGRHGAAFHAARETMVSGPADLGDEETGPGGAVPDRLHHGDGQTSVPECRGPGPPA